METTKGGIMQGESQPVHSHSLIQSFTSLRCTDSTESNE